MIVARPNNRLVRLFMIKSPNFAFEADAVRQRAVSCCVRAQRGVMLLKERKWK